MSVERNERRLLAKNAATLSEQLREVPRCEWPTQIGSQLRVWRSRDYLVQEFPAPDGAVRLSVNRTVRLASGRWKDGLSWDELQDIKAQCGYADRWAVEIYPTSDNVVNVANMRHLWVMRGEQTIGWTKA